MDVRCARCGTEYEFDDALVSGRGTTVKCTQCGEKFKVYRPAGEPSDDFWSVQTIDGRTLVFTSLRELQRAIQTDVIARTDLLSRGGIDARPIGKIPELVTFFDGEGSAVSLPPAPDSMAAGPGDVLGETAPLARLPDPVARRADSTSAFPPAATESVTYAPRNVASGAISPLAATELQQRVIDVPMHAHHPDRAAFEGSSPLPAPTAPLHRTTDVVAPEEDRRARLRPSYPDAPPSLGGRRSVGGYFIAFVVLAGAALIGLVWARDHLGAVLGRRTAPVVQADPRVTEWLAASDKALADGDLDRAKETVDKASALGEKEPRVAIAAARLATVRADVAWLKLRLLPTEPAETDDDGRIAHDSASELAAAARKAADAALALAPDDPSAVRAKIDALRIAGDEPGARTLVGRVSASATQPETAYVLAALDLAEKDPLWSTVLERLRVATTIESGPGRARAALVYALARAGDPAAAKAEVDRLAAMARPHPLLPLLRAFVGRAKSAPPRADGAAADAGIAAGEAVARGDGGAASAVAARAGSTEKTAAAGPRGPDAPRASPGEVQKLVAQGEAARAKGDYARALQNYTAALEKNPNDTVALHGVAAVAHARRDLNGARASYKRVLSINPTYVPALVGVGDVDWESGDRASAMKTYKEIVDRFPEGTYPARVRERAEVSSPSQRNGADPTEAPAHDLGEPR